jgi:hypothetical protein
MSTATAERQDMARSQHGGKRPGSGRPKGSGSPETLETRTARIGADTLSKLEYIATKTGRNVAAVVEDVARPAIVKEFARLVKEEGIGQ